MKFLKKLKRYVFIFTLCFSACLLFFGIFGYAMNKDNVIFCGQILWNALFSALIAVTFAITDFLKEKKVNIIIVRIIHFLLSYGAFYLTYIMGNGAEAYMRSASETTNKVYMVLAISLFFVLIYTVVGTVRIIAGNINAKIENRNKEYESIYKK